MMLVMHESDGSFMGIDVPGCEVLLCCGGIVQWEFGSFVLCRRLRLFFGRGF